MRLWTVDKQTHPCKVHSTNLYIVDAAAIGGRKMLLPGEILTSAGWRIVRKSAEVIVVVEYELRTDTAEASQINEGLNIEMFQMPQGSSVRK
jgi:hypothetical protein